MRFVCGRCDNGKGFFDTCKMILQVVIMVNYKVMLCDSGNVQHASVLAYNNAMVAAYEDM